MFGYFALVSLFPRLDTPRHEAAWRAYWSPGVSRRVLPLLVLGTMTATTLPVRAVAGIGDITYDPAAWTQRGIEFVKNEWRFLWSKQESLQKKIRDGLLAYRAYRQARDIYERVQGGNISISLVNALPMVEMESDLGGGQQETLTLRPIFTARDRQRIGVYHGPKIRFDVPDLSHLDVDVDRNVVTVGDPTTGKSLQELEQQASDDAWLSWTQAQKISGLDTTGIQTPESLISATPYRALSEGITQQRQQRIANLQAIARVMLKDYGEDSIQYAQAMDTYASANRALTNGTDDQEDQALITRLQALGAEAARARGKYADNNLALSSAMQRAATTTTTVNQIAAKYDSGSGKPWGIGQFIDIVGQVEGLMSTLDAMEAGSKSNSPISKEPLGNQQKATVLMRWVGDNTNEALKLQTLKAQEEAQSDMLRVAKEQAQAIADAKAKRDLDDAKDAALLAQTKMGQILSAMEGATLAALQPVGLIPIIPDTAINAGVGGGAVGSAGADDAIKANIQTVAKNTGNKLTRDIPQAIQDSGSTLSWGLLRPLAQALDAGARTVLHKSFDLSRWTEA